MAFGRDIKYVTIRGIKDKLDRYLKVYRNKVYAKGVTRAKMKAWKAEHNELFDILAKDVDPNKFDEAEREYFYDQKQLKRKWRLDIYHIDMEHERQVQQVEHELQDAMEEEREQRGELATEPVMESSIMNLNYSMNRSGLIRDTTDTTDSETQTDVSYSLRDGVRNFKESVKVALANTCAEANVSPNQSRVVFQVISEQHFGATYRLSPESSSDEPPLKKTRSKADYAEYCDVIPSSKAITKMKHLMAIQQERNAALALLDTTPSDPVTLHYDTTTRKRLNGEWPSIVLKTSSGKTFRLRSLNMAVEDRKAIRKDERLNMILRICKDHGGPFTSVKEIEDAMKTIQDEQKKKKMLRNEILLRKSMSRKDCRENPDLYKVNCMTVAQLKVNLGILLSGEHEVDCDADIMFPDAESMFDALDDSVDEPVPLLVEGDDDILLNEPCVAIWDNVDGRYWCVGMTRERIGKDEYLIDYLECMPNDNLKKTWRYPSKVDEQKNQKIQILPCNVIGSWDLTKRKSVFVLHNNDVINELFKSLY